jgi:hypothetical protein
MAALLEMLAFIALVVTIIAGLFQIADRLDQRRDKTGKKEGKEDE